MLKERIKTISVLLYGMTLTALGVILLIRTQWMIDLLYRINLFAILGLSASRVLTGILEKDRNKRTNGVLYGTFIFILFLLVLNFPVFFGAMIPFLYGLWALLSAVVKFITWYNFHVDKIYNRIWAFLDAFITFIFAMLLILDPLPGVLRLTYVASAYLIFYGIMQLFSGINLLLNDLLKDRYKIFLHFPLPMFLSVLLPSRIYKDLHKPSTRTIDFRQTVDDPQAEDELEIFIHLKEGKKEGLGHVDISYRDFIFSYGLHDPLNRHLNGTYGDGVLIQADRKRFIEYSISGEKKTIVAFTLKLSPQQIKLMEERVIGLLERTEPWYPRCFKDDSINDYSSRIYKNTGAKFYKFTNGKFKTYFFASTNCVLLADHFVQFKGLELVRLNGLITPGSYFNFLNEAYQRSSPMVTRRIVYEKMKNNANNASLV